MLETFILFEDKVGLALLQAASRGAQIDMTIDGYGSPDLSASFISALTQAGVRVHVFEPGPKLWGWRTNLFRRMHRKLVVVDAERNAGADPGRASDLRQRLSAGASALTGQWRGCVPGTAGDAAALFVTRDNRKHTNDIERHYRIAIRAAHPRMFIANAYFFPGYRLLREMRRAARRGVDVRLILQGQPDMPIVKIAASLLYRHLLDAGVQIYEYCERPLHGKVAVADDAWATLGSSNLDPLSLSLNLEAKVIIRDAGFTRHLAERLEHLMQHSCQQIEAGDLPPASWRDTVRSFFVFHLLRRYPAWVGWLPAHAPRLTPAMATDAARTTDTPKTSAEAVGADRVKQADPA